MVAAPKELTLTTYADVRDAFGTDALERSLNPERYERGNIMESVILMLAGQDHRDRRRVENALFRRDRLAAYESKLFPPIIDATLALERQKSTTTDLIELGALLTVVLSGETAGIDFDATSVNVRRELVSYLHVFARGEAIDAELDDVETVKAIVGKALEEFRNRYFEASRARRQAALQSGSPEEAPADVLTALLASREPLGLDDDAILRETAFFFEAGAHTSTQTFTNSIHYILGWISRNEDREALVRNDLAFVQRCVHEALRLRPTNPAVRRRAVRDVSIGGSAIEAGTLLTLDTASANRDPSVYGDDAEEFRPDRTVPPTALRFGHSFGGGLHACIGRNLAVGLPIKAEGLPIDHLFGVVPLMVQAVFQAGVRPHSELSPAPDEGTRRWTRWRSYPVTLAPAAS